MACVGKFVCALGGERKKEQYKTQGEKEDWWYNVVWGAPAVQTDVFPGG